MNLILTFLLFRVGLDFIYPYEKPSIMLGVYLVFNLVLIFIHMDKFSFRDIKLSLLLLFTTLYSTLLNLHFPAEQLTHVFKVLLPMFFLLSIKNSNIDFDILRAKSKKLFVVATPIFIVLFFGSFNLADIFQDFENNPTHTVSQNIAKIALLYMHPAGIPFMFFFATLVLLNVRSNIIPVLLLAVKDFFKSYTIITKIIVVLVLVFVAVNITGLVDRFLFKGRVEDDLFNNMTSGRLELLIIYYDYIVNNFSFIDYILGVGNLNLQGVMRLSAHNDLINVFVEFGLLGLVAFYLVYKELYMFLEPKFRLAVTFYFIVVFFTNGILFHQSNVLFVLYLMTKKKDVNVRTS